MQVNLNATFFHLIDFRCLSDANAAESNGMLLIVFVSGSDCSLVHGINRNVEVKRFVSLKIESEFSIPGLIFLSFASCRSC